MDDDVTEPCGSWRVFRWFEGIPCETRWCDRVDGPCPFPGTDQQPRTERRCGAEPGTVLRVTWADECIDDSLIAMETLDAFGTTPNAQNVQVAIAALRACGAESARVGVSEYSPNTETKP